MRNQHTKLLAMSQRSDLKVRRSLFFFLLLLTGLIVAGSVDAALHKQVTQNSTIVQQDADPLLKQMLKHALVAYANGSYEKAYQRLLPLAQQNIVDAQYYLATLYDDGRGVMASSAMSAYWYRRAAKLGHINAQYNIGVAHASGDGVQQSLIDAVRWWRVAAVSGSVNAQFNLGILYLRGEGIRQDPVEAVRWWSKAAEQGDPAAQYNLGALYANGQGVSRNVKKALMWWTRAAAQGFQQAIVALRDYRLPKQVKVSTK
ncbi:MAG: sel1 repeat family protein [Sulfuriflexus sp.]|nr:sel1 repeat family protein [Sulfuriflexus sp.]